jgi:hypothetical protein
MAIEVFAGSSGKFEHCHFLNNNKAAVVLRDRSRGEFTDCYFEKTKNTSVFVSDSSVVTISNCSFMTAAKFAVYLYRSSQGKIKRCHFQKQSGKAVFALKNSVCRVSDCRFEHCGNGAVSIADGSKLYVLRSAFESILGSCIHGMQRCLVEVANCIFNDCRGNGVNFEFSDGFARDSSFSAMAYPAVAVFGACANPVVSNCQITNCTAIAVVARDGCAPVFSHIDIDNNDSHGFSISDFSTAIVMDCVLTHITGRPFCVFNAAQPKLVRNHVEIVGPFLSIATFAHPHLYDNVLDMKISPDATTIIDIHHNGELSPDLCERNTAIVEGIRFNAVLTEAPVLFELMDKASNGGFEYDFVPWDAPPAPAQAQTLGWMDFHVKPLTPPDVFKQRTRNMEEIVQMCGEIPWEEHPACLQCGEPAEVICSPCGHRVLCKKCSNEMMQRKEAGDVIVCPLCQTLFQEAVSEFGEPAGAAACAICMDASCDTVILTCGHRCACYACTTKMWTEKRQCPMCQTKITSFRRQFPISTPGIPIARKFA